MAYRAVSHEQYLDRVCGICFCNKKNRCNITSGILQDICQLIYTDYSLESNVLPRVICQACRLKLKRLKSVSIQFIIYFIYQ